MESKRILRIIILIVFAMLLILVDNVKAFDQITIYLPILAKGIEDLPSPTAPTPPTEPPPPGDTGNIVITTISYNGSGAKEPDEFVEIRNDDTKSIQLKNWTLSDASNHVFTFPSFHMEPGRVCRVYTNEYHPQWCGFNYGNSSAIWNNSGDTATLKDGYGIIIDILSYLQLLP